MPSYPIHVKKEILARAKKEQDLREKWERDLDNPKIIAEVKAVDKANTHFLKPLIERYGWPRISAVGNKTAMSVWLILQHSPDLKFMERCLELMQSMPDEVEPANLARTIDRVRILKGQKQYYGTHFILKEDGKYHPQPIEDEKRVEERRLAMGLPTIAEKSKEYNG